MSFEWTELTYQQILSGDTAACVYILCMFLVYLVLAAQYESLILSLAIILIVPMSILTAMFGVWISGGDNNIFTQIGLFVLIGLAWKNAILMTSLAFIMGVVPLVFSSGSGAEMRHATGVAVFSSMIGLTMFGLFLTPVFYVLLLGL